MSRTALAVVVAVGLTSACSSLDLKVVDASVRKPSHVALFFAVERGDGQPVATLGPGDFTIVEDGHPLPAAETQQTLLGHHDVAAHHTLLLLDLGAVATRPAEAPALVAAATAFVERIAAHQRVAVYGFDGGADLVALARFGADPRAAVAGLAGVAARDPSRNLRGAVTQALDVVDDEVGRSKAPLRFGTLVVFTGGPDRAGRATADEVERALDVHAVDVVTIGVGPDIDERELTTLGRTAAFTSRRAEDLGKLFAAAAQRVDEQARRFYLLSYCTPARAGDHVLEVKARDGSARGTLRYGFNADGFGPGCNAQQAPSFGAREGRAAGAGAADKTGADDGERHRNRPPPPSPRR